MFIYIYIYTYYIILYYTISYYIILYYICMYGVSTDGVTANVVLFDRGFFGVLPLAYFYCTLFPNPSNALLLQRPH